MKASFDQNKQAVRNPKLKIMMIAVFTAIIVDAIIAAYAPVIISCSQGCDVTDQTGPIAYLINLGLMFPRIEAYGHIQTARGLIYPLPALAFTYGIFCLELLIGIAITWPVILIDCIQWAKTFDFSQPLGNEDNTRRVTAAMMLVIVLGIWGTFFRTSFSGDHHFSETPDFSTNMLPALAFPVLYMLSSMLFGIALRLTVFRIRHH